MSNVLTGLIPTIYNALDIVSREPIGLLPAVTLDAQFTRAAVGQTVTSPVAPAAVGENITPGVTPPSSGGQTIGAISMSITKARAWPILWQGEEVLGVNNNGAKYNTILSYQFQQAFRAATGEMESDLANLFANASRAFGTAGTTPFASDVSASANMRKLLMDNGAPLTDLQLIIDTTSGAKLRSLTQLTKVNEAGSADTLMRGKLIDLSGFAIRESNQIKTPAKGTGSAYTTNTAGYAVGATSITLITGSGTVLAGDIVTFAGDTNKYVVATGVAAPGAIVLANPGLRVAIPTSATALTIENVATRNMAFARTAIALATRAPALPEQGDLAAERITVADPVSGVGFEIAYYLMYRQIRIEVAAAWGVACVKPEHLALLEG